MTLIKNALAGILEKRVTERLPSGSGSGLGLSGVIQGQGIGGAGKLAQLNTFGTASWLDAVVGMISESCASIPWTFHVQARDGTLKPLGVDHPLSRLWNKPSPFMTGRELREIGHQHMCLVGERWRLVLRGQIGQPLELWPIRPDRIRPVESATAYIDHYIYQIGALRIRLELEDIIFDRTPSPVDMYRGIGPIPALLLDIGNERAAASWTSAFFNNSAEPGGIIEYEKALTDDQFQTFRDRWQLQHRGVGNAHRVAIIEQGKWVDRKYTQRDMQFEQLRKLNRDTILGAYRMPAAMMGISESVNRANALAAETHFGRWVVVPKLEREQESINTHLTPLYGPNIVAIFKDPTPEDRELNLDEATEGYSSGVVTLNEARARLNLPEIDGGDEVKPEPVATPFRAGMGIDPTIEPWASAFQGLSRTCAELTDDLLLKPTVTRQPAEAPDVLEPIEQAMLDGWQSRLALEADALVTHMEQFKGLERVAGPPLALWNKTVFKIELSDVDSYNWDWWTRYSEEVIEELNALFTASVTAQLPGLEPALAQRLAQEYAATRGAELLSLQGTTNLVNVTRERVRTLVAGTIERGDSLGTLQRSIRSDFIFSRSRANTISRTETGMAHGSGSKQAALIEGSNEKRWITQGDDVVDPQCVANELAGWIPIVDSFPSGVDHIPDHPNCRCNTIYRIRPEPEPEILAIARCPDCDRVLQRDVPVGSRFYCRSKDCRKVVVVR